MYAAKGLVIADDLVEPLMRGHRPEWLVAESLGAALGVPEDRGLLPQKADCGTPVSMGVEFVISKVDLIQRSDRASHRLKRRARVERLLLDAGSESSHGVHDALDSLFSESCLKVDRVIIQVAGGHGSTYTIVTHPVLIKNNHLGMGHASLSRGILENFGAPQYPHSDALLHTL